MSEKISITLKEDQPEQVEITLGCHSLTAAQGEVIELEINQAEKWLRSSAFVVVGRETVTESKEEAAAELTLEDLLKMRKDDLVALAKQKGIATVPDELNKRQIAELITGN